VKRWGVLLSTLLVFVLAALPAAASANNLFTLDGSPVTNGHLAEDPAGNAYVAWTSQGSGSSPEPVKFCKIAPGGTCKAETLPIPGASDSLDSVSGAFPVLVPGTEIVYVVAPRYLSQDIVFWTSTNGGASFNSGTERPYYWPKTDPTDVFLYGATFMISGYNAGLAFSLDETGAPGGGEMQFADPGVGGVAGASMGLDAAANPVIAYWNISDPPYPLLFYRFDGSGSMLDESNWVRSEVTKGYEPNLSSGAAGLFMVSEDYTGGQYPNAIHVRRFDGTNFGPATTLAIDASTDLFVGGAIAQSPDGNRVVVAWPGTRAGDDAFVMRLFTSTDRGASFPVESHVAHLETSYAIGPNAEVATNDAGNGWVLWQDSAGLRIADLSPIAGLPPSPPPLPPIYKGKTKKFVKKVGNFLITLRLPKSCLQSRQRFFAGVGKRKRKQLQKRLGGKVHFTKVVFIYDGKKLKVKKKKPFRYLIDPGPMAAGSTHVVKAKVTLILEKGSKKMKIKRTIKGTVKAC
jgi:hypothetical protein